MWSAIDNMRYIGLLFLLLLVPALVSCDLVSEETPYTEKSFAVAADTTHTVTVQMERGHTLEGSFSISGEDDTTDFRIEGPNHELAYGEERAQGALSFEMKAQYSGAYTLYFDRKIYHYPSPLQIDLQYRSR